MVHQVGQQRRLADPGLPAEYQRTTAGTAGVVQQGREAFPLPIPTMQHTGSVGATNGWGQRRPPGLVPLVHGPSRR